MTRVNLARLPGASRAANFTLGEKLTRGTHRRRRGLREHLDGLVAGQ
jgi:hypothetical protein